MTQIKREKRFLMNFLTIWNMVPNYGVHSCKVNFPLDQFNCQHTASDVHSYKMGVYFSEIVIVVPTVYPSQLVGQI